MILFENKIYSITEDALLRDGKKVAFVDKNGGLVSYATEFFPGKKVPWSWQVVPKGEFPTIQCDFPLMQSVAELALETFLLNCGEEGPWRAGFKYLGWVRDNAFHALFGAGLLSPQAGYKSLKQWAGKDRITFEQFPRMTDSIIWVLAAYEFYLQTLDREFLELIYTQAANSLDFIIGQAFNDKYKLITGGNVTMDSSSGYPVGVYEEAKEMASDTNMVYCRVFEIVERMENLLGLPKRYDGMKEEIRDSINRYFYQPDGSYCQFLDKDGAPSQAVSRMACIFAALWDICDQQQRASIENYIHWAINPFGVKPVEPARILSHFSASSRIFPLSLASRAFRNPEITDLCLAASLYTTATALSFREAIDDRGIGWRYFGMMWDALSFLSLIFHSTLGLDFTEKGFRFSPINNRLRPDYLRVENLSIYGTKCNITLGSPVEPVSVNGAETGGVIKKESLGERNEVSLGNVPAKIIQPKKIAPIRKQTAKKTMSAWQVTVYAYCQNLHLMQMPEQDFNFRCLPYPLHSPEKTFAAENLNELVEKINFEYPKYVALRLKKTVAVEQEGAYDFTLQVRDGGRLFIDNCSVVNADGIDRWQPAANESTVIRDRIDQGRIYLNPGLHLFSIDCFVRRGPFALALSSSPPMPQLQ